MVAAVLWHGLLQELNSLVFTDDVTVERSGMMDSEVFRATGSAQIQFNAAIGQC